MRSFIKPAFTHCRSGGRTTGSDRLASRQRGRREGKWRRKAQLSEEWRVRGSEEQRERASRGADRLACRLSAPACCSAKRGKGGEAWDKGEGWRERDL